MASAAGRDRTTEQLGNLRSSFALEPDPHPMKMKSQRQAPGGRARGRSLSIGGSPVTPVGGHPGPLGNARSTPPPGPISGNARRTPPNPNTPAGRTQGLLTRLEETETLLEAQRNVNRGLDKDVHALMAQLEDLNRRYAALGRRTASLQEELATAASGDFKALRQRLQRSEAANADLEQVAKEKVEAMRAERDAFAERLRAVESTATASSEFEVSDLQADLQAARAAEANARSALAEEAENAARQAAAQADVTSQLRRVQAEKAELEEKLAESEVALTASRAEAEAAASEATSLATQLEAAEADKAAVQADLQAHIERHAGGVADLEEVSRQLQATQSSAAAVSAEAAELRSEVKAVSREKRAADARVGALEVDLKAVLAKHAREVESATTARRDANRSAAAKQAADSEIKRMLGTVRGLESEKASLMQELSDQQQQVAARTRDLQKAARDLATAQSERHSAQQQVARLEGQKASLEAELQAATQELQELPAQLEAAQEDARTAQGDAQAAITQVQSLRDRVAEADADMSRLVAAAQAAEDQSVSLMQQLQAARAGEASYAREAASLAEQVSALEDQITDLSAQLGRESGDVTAPAVPQVAEGGRRSAESLHSDTSAAPDDQPDSDMADDATSKPAASNIQPGQAHPASEDIGGDVAAADPLDTGATAAAGDAVAEEALPAAPAVEATAVADTEVPSTDSAATPAAALQGDDNAVEPPQEGSLSVCVPREQQAGDAERHPSVSSPLRQGTMTTAAIWDERAAARIEAVEAEAEKLRKQVELQRHQLEAANAAAAAQAAAAERAATLAAAEAEHKQAAAAAAAAAASSTADLAAAKQRISQLEEQLQAVQAVAPASAATQAPLRLPAAAADKPKRRATGGGWEDLLDVPQDQRGAPPTPQQLALLQEQMHKLLAEREVAERQLKDLASQMGSRSGADAADAGDMSSLKRYWRENERLQREKSRVEEKLRMTMAVIPGTGLPRTLGAQDSFGSGALAAAADSALASRAEGLAVSLARAEAEARHLAAERDDLRRRLDDALAAAQASVNSRHAAAGEASSPAAAATPLAAAEDTISRPSSASGAMSGSQLRQLQADKAAAEAAVTELREQNEQLRVAATEHVRAGAAVNDAEIRLGWAQQEVERLQAEVSMHQEQGLEEQQKLISEVETLKQQLQRFASEAPSTASPTSPTEAASPAILHGAVEQDSRLQQLEEQLVAAQAEAAAARVEADAARAAAAEAKEAAEAAQADSAQRSVSGEAEGTEQQAGEQQARVAESSPAPGPSTDALREEVEHLRAAKQELEAKLAEGSPAAAGSGGADGDVDVQLLRQELEDLRHDNAEMEAGFHEAAAAIEKECAERVAALEEALAAAQAAAQEAQADAASFAQDLADHLSNAPAGGPSAADKAAVREAQGEAAAARQEVQWLTQQLSALQGGLDGAPASNQEEAEEDYLAGTSNGAAPGEEERDGGAHAGGNAWLVDGRWSALRRRGHAAGWLVDPGQVQLGAVLGQGSFGTTYRGRWRGADCAVKVVRISKPDEANSFLREVEALSLLRHPNIMPFYGAVLQPPAQCWLVCQFMPGGTLSDWLYGANADPRSSNGALWGPRRALGARMEMALAVARGMAAMESSDPPLLHRDLKPANVFIDAAGEARVADMGLARRLTPGCGPTLTGETGTYYYMAPEVIRHEVYDSKADVFSWGVMFVELLSAKPPYSDQYLTPVQVAIAVGDDKLRPSVPRGVHPGLAGIARAALDPEPSMRPDFGSLVEQLGPVAAELQAGEAASLPRDGTGVFGRLFKPQ